MYKSKQFVIRAEEDVLQEIKNTAIYYPQTRKVFLADGDALTVPTPMLLKILHAFKRNFSRLTRVSCYASAKNILAKSDEELKALYDAGLKLIYLGIETGDDDLLLRINKNETKASTIEGLLKAKEAGLKSSVMILNGLGGKLYTEQHAIQSAEVVNATQPEFTSVLVLSFPYGVEHYQKRFKGEYIPMTVKELLIELALFIEHTHLHGSIFRTDHASNYLALEGILSRDKDKLLQQLHNAIHHPEHSNFRAEWQRGL